MFEGEQRIRIECSNGTLAKGKFIMFLLRAIPTIALLTLCAGPGIPATAAPQSDLQVLQGTWTVLSIDVNGQKLPQDKVGDAQAVIEGNHYTLHDFRLTFQLDSSKTPPTIDLQGRTGRNEPVVIIGIYQLEGDTLRLCLAKPSLKDRPP